MYRKNSGYKILESNTIEDRTDIKRNSTRLNASDEIIRGEKRTTRKQLSVYDINFGIMMQNYEMKSHIPAYKTHFI